ncbi:MAG: hypothetical protein M1546_19190 [Chloroflexi bacterium]|nr:hypothetical protein [Chloroflexota bacterium]
MVTLKLTPDEADLLCFILESYLTDLRDEIRDTDNRDFRADLKLREAFLRKLLQQLTTEAEGVS